MRFSTMECQPVLSASRLRFTSARSESLERMPMWVQGHDSFQELILVLCACQICRKLDEGEAQAMLPRQQLKICPMFDPGPRIVIRRQVSRFERLKAAGQ